MNKARTRTEDCRRSDRCRDTRKAFDRHSNRRRCQGIVHGRLVGLYPPDNSLAKGGDLDAAREILTRTLGKPADAPDPDRLEVDGMGIDLDVIVTANKCRLNRPSAFDVAMDELDD